jgi:serine/threonine-protein kinase
LDPVREVAEAIVNLGIADELRLAPFIKATRERPITESTADEDSEADELLKALEKAGVIDAKQRDQIEKMLRGDLTPRAAPSNKVDPYVGKTFGAFKTLVKIGEGGMGAVYRAERLDDGSKDYVVKLLSPLGADASTYVRFRREGEVMAALRHPNVVRVYESGEVEGLSYLVMEFVDGATLQDVVEKKGRFDWQNAAKAVRQIAMGLDAAHQIGVIHRDVKPQNVLLSRTEGLLKVADFGLAKVPQRESSDPSVSRAGDILGSPAYIAPEQWGDHDVDIRADLFALGVVLYQLVCGVLPFRGRTPAEYAKKILAGAFDAVELYAPDASEGIRQIITRLLERRREHRYSTAGQLIADLERVLRGELPDVPRLVRSQGTTAERSPLVGRDLFILGRGASAHVPIQHPSVLDKHAVIERTPAGLLLREADGKGLVKVNGMRVREITLKDNDVIEIGDSAPLKYRAGLPVATLPLSTPTPTPGSGSIKTVRTAGSFVPPISVPGPLYEALLKEESSRAVLAFVELLDETTWLRRTLRARRRLLAAGVDAETAGRAAERALASYRRLNVVLPERLFRATHENLGSEPGAWLGWWFTSGKERFPAQVRPPGPRAQGAVAVPTDAAAPTIVPLGGANESWALGRGQECEIPLQERSVSRKHATIYRLLTRFAVKDEGSRFGTLLRGERKPVALLRHDDSIELGRAKIVFRQPDEPEGTGSQEDSLHGVDAPVFDALVEMRSPVVASALFGFLDTDAIIASVKAAVAKSPALGDLDVPALLGNLLDERRRVAMEALPAITRKNFGSDAKAWRAWWGETRSASRVQIVPEGWGGGL